MAETRKLAAILAFDVVGYSLLTGADEDRTLARLRALRSDLIDPTTAVHHGRVFKRTGDGALVEFRSVVDAVRCALEVQSSMVVRNAGLPAERRIEFRIGIHLGDVVEESDGDLMGDGVNIAARIEQLAEVGGICVTSAVHAQVDGRLEAAFEDLGEKSLKNITRPVRVYRVLLSGADGKVGSGPKPAVVKPSVAVLPFANMSGDPEQEFFADGLTEDILTELSRRRELFVISRTSSFVYKGKSANLREVAQKLGARYLVEGSVRKAADRVRITVQLIDTATDAHIWAERYDRKLDDIFAVQDEITTAIVATLPGRLEAAQQDQLMRTKPSSMAAYECALAAKVLHHKSTREDNVEALVLIDRALALDADYAHAHAWRGCILGQAYSNGWAKDSEATFKEVMVELHRAIALDDNDADVHRILAAVSIVRNDFTRARYHQDRALALNPNYDLVVVQMGELFTWLGPGRGRCRLDPQSDEAQSPPSSPFLEPSWQGLLRGPPVWAGDRSFHAHGKPRHTAARISGGLLRVAWATRPRPRHMSAACVSWTARSNWSGFWRRCTSRVSKTCTTCGRDCITRAFKHFRKRRGSLGNV